MAWQNTDSIGAEGYTCGWCGHLVSSNRGYKSSSSRKIFICPHCDKPTFFEYQSLYPGSAPGAAVSHLPPSLDFLYGEARRSTAASCYTAAVLCCRKLLMNIAVDKGAKQGDKFVAYVQHLSDSGYVPPDGKGWVDHIRRKGNEANHEIAQMGQADAEELVAFSEMLLKFMYEFPAKVPVQPAAP